MARRFGLLLIPPAVAAAIGAAVADGLGYAATQGVGYALLGLGAILAFTMATAGDESISGWEMRMEGREPQGRRGRRWVEQAWGTGTFDPRSLAQHHPSIDRWLVVGIAYAALGIAILVLF